MNSIITRNVNYKNFIKTCHEVHRYLNSDVYPPAEIENSYRSALLQYRSFLDNIGYNMPIQKYPYNPDNDSTWKFKDVKIFGERKKKNLNAIGIKNDKWIYKK